MSLLLWNIRGGLTTKLPAVQDLFADADLLLLTETHQMPQQSLPSVPGFVCISSARPLAKDTAVRNKGGIAAYVKADLADAVSLWKAAADSSYLWLRINRNSSSLPDIFVCVAYVAPFSSVAHTRFQALPDPLQRIYADVATIKNLGGLTLLAGDFNARTREDPDYVRCDNLADVMQAPHLLEDDLPQLILPRCNSDKGGIQGWGRQLLDLCIDTSLLIMNGRVAGDTHGELTCLANKGASVVDYFVASPAILERATQLQVLTDDMLCGRKDSHSDHRPLHLQLELDWGVGGSATDDTINPDGDPVVLHCFKYDPVKVDAYRDSLAASLHTALADGTHISVAALQQCICTAAEQTYGLKAIRASKDQFRHQPWFDNDCKAEKRRLRLYLKTKEPNDRVAAQMKKDYKRLLTKKRCAHEKLQAERLCRLAKDNPAAFWKAYRVRETATNHITPDGWLDAFKALVGQPSGADDVPDQPPHQDEAGVGSANPSQCECSDLNADITLDEIAAVVKRLKRNKAAGIDGIKAEFILDAYTILAPHLQRVFNAMLHNHFPPELAVGVIHPIYKNGDPKDPGNYRGITVGPVLAKMFAMILDQRLAVWTEKNKLRAKGQAGFRKDHRTTDNLFIIKTLIDQRTSRRGAKLYCCFVDFKKAFDTVPRSLLWQVLVKLGVKGRILDCLQSMYASDSACVQVPGSGATSTFACHMGVKQGCPLSPNLFGLYIDGFEDWLGAIQCTAPTLAGQAIALLLYADDLALFSETAAGLQRQIDVLAEFCAARQLSVNVKKTKIVVFETRTTACQDFIYHGEVIERVVSFRYLGVELHSTRGLSFAIEKILVAGRKSMFALQRRCAELKITDPRLRCQLFDTLVAPVINYGCEIWAGEAAAGKLEVIHNQFLKMTAGLSQNTNSYLALAEFGQYPMYCQQWQQRLRYVHRLADIDSDRLLHSAMHEQQSLLDKGKKCWLQSTLAWVSKTVLVEATTQAVLDLPVASIVASAQASYLEAHQQSSSSSRIRTYQTLRQGYHYEPYLTEITHIQLRKTLTRFRCSNHSLAIEAERKAKGGPVPYHSRRCVICSLDAIEDEDHFVCVCPALQGVREKYSSRLPLGPTNTWIDVMHSQDQTLTAKYLAECLSLRQTLVNRLMGHPAPQGR